MATNKRPYKQPVNLLCDASKVIDMALVEKYIGKHEERLLRYNYLESLYKGFHDVYKAPEKPDWKPDWRLAANFPRYITETFLGYAYGIPIKKTSDNEDIEEIIRNFETNNDIDDHEGELEKYCCIYGHAFEYMYQDEYTKTKMVACTPKEVFVVYDDTIKTRALFAVRYGYHDEETTRYGEILTRDEIILFDRGQITERRINPYGKIPVVEWILNSERIGIFEEVTNLVEVYNHTLGEKANDVDAFAEAYLAILGAEVDDDGVRRIRDDRIINMYGTNDAKQILVQFLQKPTADGTQENLLDRVENLIYQISMVANISDESFGNATSGTALAYKLQSMSNLAATFDRKIKKSIMKRYKLFCSLSTNISNQEAYQEIEIKTSRNIPKNIVEEAQVASTLEGVVSQETQLSVLSIVPNPKEEIARMEEEEKDKQEDVVTNRMFIQANPNDQEDTDDMEVESEEVNE